MGTAIYNNEFWLDKPMAPKKPKKKLSITEYKNIPAIELSQTDINENAVCVELVKRFIKNDYEYYQFKITFETDNPHYSTDLQIYRLLYNEYIKNMRIWFDRAEMYQYNPSKLLKNLENK